ncbi:MAG: phosphotransferase [Actinomycetota bacterium]
MPLLVRRLLLAPSIVSKRSSEGSADVEPSVASYLGTLHEDATDPPRSFLDPNGIWLHVDFPHQDLPERGWKLHVSATPRSARDVLDACVPLLVDTHTPFKVAASIERLIELNEGVGGLGQAGKFITAYPATTEGSVHLASRLDAATQGLRGPRILGERGLSPASLVHYRFGDYVEDADRSEEGSPDDPFIASGLVDEPRTRLVGDRYLITATLHRSVRGAIHLAVDAVEGRTCILKRAWRDAIATPDGKDARDRLEDEARLLRALAEDPHFPTVSDVFADREDLFVAMEYIEGPTFAELVNESHTESSAPSEAQVVAWGRELAAALGSLHAAGYVHRDLNPINVIAADRLVLIDLELARPIGTAEGSFGAGTLGYASPNQQDGGAATPADDFYGLGALMMFAATYAEPDPAKLPANLSSPIAEVVARCLGRGEPFTSVVDVESALGQGIPS